MPYWIAYQDIAGSRQYTSSGVADIPYSEKITWLDENGITDIDERKDYLQIISSLDSEYLKDYYEKHKVK
jgi:hypothetical protein